MNIDVAPNNNVLILLNIDSHIDFISSYLKENGCNPVVIKTTRLSQESKRTLNKIKNVENLNNYKGIIISSEIDSYKVNKLPDFFFELRKIIGNKPVVFFHPSRVHATDRNLIMKAIKQPFMALQGHDLEFDPRSELESVLQPLLN